MTAQPLTAAVVGASGYVGGELLRLLLGHPWLRVTAAISNSLPGRRVDGPHPNLRGRTDLRFGSLDRFAGADVVFLAVPHGQAAPLVSGLLPSCKVLVDLSADFRLPNATDYERYYGWSHPAPHLLAEFVPGLPELHRTELRTADRISGPGCMATAAILALHPLVAGGLMHTDISVDARTGSSGSGRRTGGAADAHSERSSAMRVFAPLGHRHEAEIEHATGARVRMSATGVPAVRGAQVLCRGRLRDGVTEPDVRGAYRTAYAGEPFVRVVAQRRGTFRYPEPAILLGSNFCDVGHSVAGGEIAVIGALDNLVKGAAGNAVQSVNVRMGWPEPSGLEFAGLHPL